LRGEGRSALIRPTLGQFSTASARDAIRAVDAAFTTTTAAASMAPTTATKPATGSAIGAV